MKCRIECCERRRGTVEVRPWFRSTCARFESYPSSRLRSVCLRPKRWTASRQVGGPHLLPLIPSSSTPILFISGPKETSSSLFLRHVHCAHRLWHLDSQARLLQDGFRPIPQPSLEFPLPSETVAAAAEPTSQEKASDAQCCVGQRA
jgi:hypothetical protein